MVAYPNQVAFALFSFQGSDPHVGVCFGIKDLTFRGGLGARRISWKMNWMDERRGSRYVLSGFLKKSHARRAIEKPFGIYGDYG